VITVTLRLHGDLLPLVRGGGKHLAPDRLVRRLPAPTSAKDAVEATGIPHCEIGRIESTGRPLDMADSVGDGACLDVFPTAQQHLREPRFLCDQHLGKLARLLRIMGFDVAYGADWSPPEVARRTVNTELQRFQLAASVQLFGRCGLCNGQLKTVAKHDVADRIPPLTARWLDVYYLCDSCDQLYWEGTHVSILRDRVAAIISRAG
jgi:uncharacterized protein with PIN domain